MGSMKKTNCDYQGEYPWHSNKVFKAGGPPPPNYSLNQYKL